MNKDDIIRMAQEAGLVMYDYYYPSLERFAALVAAAEREVCANLVEQAGVDGYGTLVAALLIRERGAP